MTAPPRYHAPPLHTSGGPHKGNCTRVFCHAKRDAKGMAPVLRTDTSGRPLTQFLVKATGALKEKLRARGVPTSRTIWLLGWDEAQVERAKIIDAWTRIERPEDVVHTMNELAQKFLAVKGRRGSRARKSTVAAYARRLALYVLPYFGSRELPSITPEDIDAWSEKHNSTGSSRTRQARLGTLTALFRFGEAYKWVASPIRPEHAIEVLKVGKRRGDVIGDERVARALSQEKNEIEQIVAALDEGDPALRMMVRLMAWMGQRNREALHIRVADCVFADDGSAFIWVASDFPCDCVDCRINGGIRFTKNQKLRLVPIHFSLIAPLKEYLLARAAHFAGLHTPWLFPLWRRGHSPASIGSIRTAPSFSAAFKSAAKRAGFDGLIVHDLRATAKTALILNLGNAAAIDYALGHAPRSAMDEVYVKYEREPGLLYRAVFPGVLPPVTLVKDWPAPRESDRLMTASR